MWTIGENLYVKKYPFSNETNQCGQVKENKNATGWDEKGYLKKSISNGVEDLVLTTHRRPLRFDELPTLKTSSSQTCYGG